MDIVGLFLLSILLLILLMVIGFYVGVTKILLHFSSQHSYWPCGIIPIPFIIFNIMIYGMSSRDSMYLILFFLVFIGFPLLIIYPIFLIRYLFALHFKKEKRVDKSFWVWIKTIMAVCIFIMTTYFGMIIFFI